MISNHIKMTSNESVKNKKNKLKKGEPDDYSSHGRDLIEQAFSSA